jgi:hypothetical protein
MNNKIVTDDFVSQLLESNSWDKAGINIEEFNEESAAQRRENHRGARGVKTPKGGKGLHSRVEQHKRGQRQATTGGASTRGELTDDERAQGRERREGRGAYATRGENTEVEANCCPLCEADFGDMELTDEALQEHASNMMEVFSEAGLISESVEESFIIENAEEILGVLSDAGLIVEATNEDED